MKSIHVIATTYDGTRAAIETAVLLARASESTLSVLVPQIVPHPVDIVASSASLDEVVDEYRQWLVDQGGSGHVRICLCRDLDDVIERLTVPNATLVIGGPSGRWRMSPEERFANRLSRQGRQVLFAATGPSPTSRRRAWTAALVCVVSASALSGNASAQPAAIQYGGFLDAAILASSTDPPNHLFRNRGTTPRLDELDLNMAAAYVRKGTTDVSPFGFEATVQAGEDSKLFGYSATAPNIAGADVLTHFGPTSASYRAPVGSGLTIQGGIFSSLIGYDSLYVKDNFAYTRPWGADYTPYLMLGVNAAYPVTPRLTVTGFVVNGYWHLAHANDVPSVGSQVAFMARGGLSLKQTVLYGPHQTDTSIALWRILSDSIVERKLNRLTIAGELQVSTERVDSASRAWWLSVQTPVHVLIAEPWSATVRPEWCRDSEGRWTGFVQSVAAITTTVEYRLSRGPSSARLRAEYRYDRSTGAGGGFFAGPTTLSETLWLVPGQHLAIGAVILAFDGIAGRP